MKYFAIIILVAATIAVTNCAPLSMEQEKDFEKFLQFVKYICQEKTINYKLVNEILEDPSFNIRKITENSEKSIKNIKLLICPEERSVEQELRETNSRAMKFTSASVQTTLRPESLTSSRVTVSDQTMQDIKTRQVVKDSDDNNVSHCSKGSVIMELLCKIKVFLADMVSKKVEYLVQYLKSMLSQ